MKNLEKIKNVVSEGYVLNEEVATCWPRLCESVSKMIEVMFIQNPEGTINAIKEISDQLSEDTVEAKANKRELMKLEVEKKLEEKGFWD